MIYGMFPFMIATATYQQLQRSTNWRHPSSSRVGDMPAYQFVGRGEDTITLDGSIVPEFGSQMSITALRTMGDTGKPFPLISGTGKVYGLYIMTDVSETQTYFFSNGKPRKIEFSIKLTMVQKPGVLIGNTVGRMIGFLT